MYWWGGAGIVESRQSRIVTSWLVMAGSGSAVEVRLGCQFMLGHGIAGPGSHVMARQGASWTGESSQGSRGKKDHVVFRLGSQGAWWIGKFWLVQFRNGKAVKVRRGLSRRVLAGLVWLARQCSFWHVQEWRVRAGEAG